MKKSNILYALLILLAAAIWGFAFTAQSIGLKSIPSFTFNSIRFLIGAFVLLPFVIARKPATDAKKRPWYPDRSLLVGCFLCGAMLTLASSFQQAGLIYTTVGKSSFLTPMYIVIVPLLSLFLGKKVPKIMWLCLAIAVVGMYLLCINEGFTLGYGDALTIICAFFFACHIQLVSRYSPSMDPLVLSCVQFFVVGILCAICACFFETTSLEAILSAKWALLYAGVLSCGVAYTLQVYGQRDVNPTVASLMMSMESVFGLLGGWLILGERLTTREATGCLLMFVAIILPYVIPGNLSQQ